MHYIDLHVHSTFSDGTLTPKELVELAIKENLTAIALTDHDTVEGIPFVLEAAKNSPVTVIPGIELSTDYHGTDIHILGLYIDHNNPVFLDLLHRFQRERLERNEKICNKLRQGNFNISLEELQAAYPDAILTRCHIARLLKDKHYVSSIKEAFDTLIGSQCPYYVPRTRITPMEAVKLITSVKGTPVLAHPLLYNLPEKTLRTLIEELISCGLKGLEAIYSCNEGTQEQDMKKLATEYGLSISGGSDFHGSNKPDIFLGRGKNNILVPEYLLSDLKPY